MPPKVGSSRSAKNTTIAKHTKVTKKRPTRKNAKAIKKPGKNMGLNPSLNSDASQVGVSAEQPQPPVSYEQLVSLINSEGMDEDSQDDEIEEDEMEEGDVEDDEMQDDNEGFGQLGPSWGYAEPLQGYAQPLQDYAQPTQGYTEPLPDYAEPLQGYAQPLQDYAQPMQGYAEPSPDYAEPLQGYAQPLQGYAQPMQGYAQPTPDYAQPSQGYAQSSQGYYQFHQPPQPASYLAHTYGLPQAPPSFTPLQLASREAQQFDVPTPTTFRNIVPMHARHREEEQARYAGRLPIDLPGIRKVFVYDPRRPPEEH